MKKLVSLILVSLSFSAFAGDKVDKELSAPLDGVVEIHNVRGEINIIGWDQPKVTVKGTLDDLTEKFVFASKGSTTYIKVKLPKNSRHHNRDGSNLSINVPQGSEVVFSGVATDLTISKIDGGLDIKSVSGDISINETKGRTQINSISGILKLKDVVGSLEVSTISGDLDADVSCDKVRVSGVSADLKVKLDSIQSAKVSNVSGDTTISGVLNSDGELDMGSVSGTAVYVVDGELDARVVMETAPGGDIVNDYTDDKPISSFINSQNLRFTAGEGKGRVKMSTVSGDVGLKANKKSKD
ncbi:DUF4097 domain-containing protein [Aliikangiella marina]|uniref:DUF4097 domain-containing protein n=1 Tax=Aliikangiella marina TaxID=1712262 RepID=A0A545TH20_9GAMM|nr:DUF4097 family beta strand repeat-containing protein [Aliikangiella marina]TQV76530.1 DUF4097 domain-containing protein [Aliikangiella marina]